MDAKSRWWKNGNIQITLGNDRITLENTTNFLKELQKQTEFLTWLCFPLLNYLVAFNHIQVSYPAVVSEFLAVIFTGTKASTALTNFGGERQRSMRIHVTHWLVWSCCGLSPMLSTLARSVENIHILHFSLKAKTNKEQNIQTTT